MAEDYSNLTNEELQNKGLEAARRYLVNQDYEFLQINDREKIPFVARDPQENCIRFISVKTTRKDDEDILKESEITSDDFEKRVSEFMSQNNNWDDSTRIVYDAIAILVVKPHSALLRHHKGALNFSQSN